MYSTANLKKKLKWNILIIVISVEHIIFNWYRIIKTTRIDTTYFTYTEARN